jgi:hypothetical protein
MKIRPVRAEFFHAGRQADVTEAVVTFRNFTNAPGKVEGKVRRRTNH